MSAPELEVCAIKWFSYTEAQEPRAQYDEFKKLITTGAPLKTLKTDKLDFDWGGELGPGLPRDKFATLGRPCLTRQCANSGELPSEQSPDWPVGPGMIE